jgi:hypothetical protein
MEWLHDQQAAHPDSELKTVLGEMFTKKMATLLTDQWSTSKPMKQYTPAGLRDLAGKAWRLAGRACRHRGLPHRRGHPRRSGHPRSVIQDHGVTESQGLYFIGEVLDVSGHLGGFNFQWACASGHAAAQFV